MSGYAIISALQVKKLQQRSLMIFEKSHSLYYVVGPLFMNSNLNACSP